MFQQLKLKKSGPSASTHVARNKQRAAPVSTNQKSIAPTAEHAAAPEASAPENVPNSSNVDVEGL